MNTCARIAIIISITLLIYPARAWAGPPTIEELEATPTNHGDYAENLKALKKNLDLKLRVDELEQRKKNPLNFLSLTERDRIDQIKPIVVPNDTITHDPASHVLSVVCKDALGWDIPDENVGLKQFFAGDHPIDLLIEKINKQPEDQQPRIEFDKFGDAIHELCSRIRSNQLIEEDLGVLRHIFAGDHAVLTAYQAARVLVDATKVSTRQDLTKVLAGITTATPAAAGSALALGPAATTAFEGLAEFLIDRAKEETLSFVRDQFAEQVCTSDVGVFMPELCTALYGIDSQMSIAAMGSFMHAAAILDLELLPDRVLVLAWLRKPATAIPGTMLRVALPIFQDARRRANPLYYAASIRSASLLDCEKSDPKAAGDKKCATTMAYIRAASAMVHASLRVVATAEYETNVYGVLGAAFGFERAINELPVYVRQQLKDKIGGGNWTLDLAYEYELEPFQMILRAIQSTQMSTADLWQSYQLRAGPGQPPLSDEEVLELAHRSISVVVDALRGLEVIVLPDAKTNFNTVIKGLKDIDTTLTVAESIHERDWAHAVLATIELANSILPEANEELGLSYLRKYLPLVAEIANADSSADVNTALQAAFPEGGYKRKFVEPAISINGFLGIYGGAVHHLSLSEADELEPGQLSGEFAMFAPIGVHVTSPVGRNKKRRSNLGVLVGVVDLGAITTSKWIEEETNPKQPTTDDMGMADMGTVQTEVGESAAFNLAGLLAPGLYLTTGIARSPFVLGLGGSVAPFTQKRTITERDSAGDIEATDEKFLPAIRFGVFLAVDITFVSFGLGKRGPR